jgi:predicted amidohydrolase
MRAAAVQLDAVPADVDANLAATERLVDQATAAGATVLHAAHAGALRCRMPWLPVEYHGRFEGATMIVAADGTVLAARRADESAGVVVADVDLGRRAPKAEPPDSFWLYHRGALPTATWHYQRLHGRRYYRRHVVRAEAHRHA